MSRVLKKTARRPISDDVIRIRGARQNNLKGIDLDLPLGKLNVITGPSGSGKSSLAFDTIYAEGQRRYVETFSPYTRQFFERMDKPQVDSIEGIPPAIAIEQVNNMRSTRSTVGTITEINDYLKMLFPRLASATCPSCKQAVKPETTESILHTLLHGHTGKQALILFPVPVPKNTASADFAAFLQAQGFVRIWLYGQIVRLDEITERKLPAQVMVVQDRVTLEAKQRARISEAVEAAIRFGKGKVATSIDDETRHFSTDWSCADCGITLPAPTPGLFSFNSPIGACPTCRGFGRTLGLDMGKAIPDESLSINQGLVRPFQGSTYGESQLDLERAARKRGVDIHKPFEDYSDADRKWLIEGTNDDPEVAYNRGEWYGVRGFFKWQESRSYKMHVRVFLSRYRAYTECMDCGGGRLKKEAHNFRIGEHTLADLWRLPVSDLHPLVQSWQLKEGDHAAAMLRDEIASRISYMDRAGLGYLNLDRQTRTLSGGELQRVNLTTCLGASLVNTLFVLDEPSIGLHPRDIGRLIGVMESLRDKGNTLLVVEHEEAVMRSADNVIDIGPGRGDKGGELVFSGPLSKLSAKVGSLTGDYLFGRKSVPVPKERRTVSSLKSQVSSSPIETLKSARKRQLETLNLKPGTLSIHGARQNNLKKLDVDIPLGVFCCVTGVSGSGKSTLVHDVLYRNLQKLRGEVCEDEPGRVSKITGHENLREVVMVDQSPLARTPRSTPAVFLGAFDHIRTLFSETEDAKTQGIMPGFFSFNSGEGRCERCAGNGYEKIEMQFLSDLYVTCPECEGRRYQPHALKILLHGKSIHDVLGLTAEESVAWFSSPLFESSKKAAQIVVQLQMLNEAGLGYLKLGQPLNTLSGGEAQRLKLIGHLIENPTDPKAKQGSGSLLLLDEPTTGLHFDDIAMLVKLLQRLVNEGHSLIVIEHNLEVIKCADWVIDLGPEGGAAGGMLVIAGTPEEVAECAASHTGRYLRELVSSSKSQVSSRVAESAASYRTRQLETLNLKPETKNVISIRGAREHNLKNISLDIPRDEFVVVTGLSGSGKSSLAFDLIFAEGQRRFLDSMSVYARTFVEQMEKPEVDLITGVPPTVAIEQRISRGGGKSTVATVTESYHFLRLLFAKLGTQYCPKCAVPVKKQSVQSILNAVMKQATKGPLHLLAPLIKARKGFHNEVADHAQRHGIETLLVDGEFRQTLGFQRLERFKEHNIDAVIAKVTKADSDEKLRPLVEAAIKMGKGTIKLRLADKSISVLSTEMSCPSCGLSFEELDPRLFSFNSPHGWCKDCRGFGVVGRKLDLSDRQPDVSVLEAEMEEERRFNSEDEEDSPRQTCKSCHGSRINEIGRAVQLQGSTIQDFTSLTAGDAGKLMGKLKFAGTEAIIARDIVKEIEQRLKFMQEVGLGYLQLNRSADTLSGGEAQRIRLSAQLGSNLRGVLYVLDEPTIGLHPRDNEKLLDTLSALRDKGNSLLVVEHDDETMRRADTILDLGPGAGKFGGEVIAQGTLAHLLKNKKSVTGQSLNKPLKHPSRGERRALPALKSKDGWLRVTGATANNLKNVDVAIPLGRLTVLTGVSGSGKSSLMHGALSPAVREKISKSKAKIVHAWKSISGFENLQTVHEVDQSPIGKTSRSCPATYVGIWDDIRKLFAQVPLARTRGYASGRFSFNTEGGRCETCGGNGEIKVEMAFLPTTRVHCETCNGLRFNAATLEVEYNGKHIGEVLRMSISEAAEFFAPVQKIARPLKLLADTGLGYLQLGQPSPTLSGGEAQRIKLVTELRSGDGRTIKEQLKGITKAGKRNLYLIEEPTIGLHIQDVAKLIDVLHRLVDEGHTVVVIEHHPDVYAEADYLIDIGPEAGAEGGRVVAAGTPEQVKKCKESRTARFL
jgi:excinuclease ABC subunit A